MAEKSREGVPALKNDEVTGMTEKKQKKVIRESGRAPRDEAAKEFLEEQEEQAGKTSARRGRQDEE
jgi:ribosomal protein S19E (S16A)